MFNFVQSPNPIISAIEKIYNQTKDSALAEGTLNGCLDSVNILCEFFQCSEEQAILLSIMIHIKFENNEVSIQDILKHTDLKISHALYLNQVLSPLVQKDWISPKQNVANYPLSRYNVNMKLIRSVLSQKMELNEVFKIENSFQLINHFHSILSTRHTKHLKFDDFVNSVNELINHNPSIDLSDFILKSNMSKEDVVYFMYNCYKYYNADESTSFDDMIREVAPARELIYELRKSFTNGTHFLISSGLLKENVSQDILCISSYVLTDKAVQAFDKTLKVHKKSSDNILQQLVPAFITEQKLIFDTNEQKLVNKLHNMLAVDRFSQLTSRLESQGMKKGINVLIYGHPGTGKTETVMQLARNSNRYILMADASKIRSKWVGETEKSIKLLFDDYRKAMQEYDETPILLFNEADAILGKRQTVNDRIDQMENSMQNILLQELENFEGIFIATTNLVENLDKAFDRRFLYKIKFEKPGEHTMLQIWKSKFPKIRTAVLKSVCSKVSLSGGQIENIRKKIVVDTLLDEKLKVTETYLLQLAQQELMLEKKNERNVIGFVQR